MQEPTFLTLDEIKLIHENQIQLYGGSLGIRDEPALISALEAPRWAHQYGQTDWVELAAIYFYHLMMNHGFIDGNKRVGTVAAILFLDIGVWGAMEQKTDISASSEYRRLRRQANRTSISWDFFQAGPARVNGRRRNRKYA